MDKDFERNNGFLNVWNDVKLKIFKTLRQTYKRLLKFAVNIKENVNFLSGHKIEYKY